MDGQAPGQRVQKAVAWRSEVSGESQTPAPQHGSPGALSLPFAKRLPPWATGEARFPSRRADSLVWFSPLRAGEGQWETDTVTKQINYKCGVSRDCE